MSDKPLEEGSGMAFMYATKRNPKAPDGKGRFLWHGEELELALWEKTGTTAKGPWRGFSFKVGPPFNAAQASEGATAPPPSRPRPEPDPGIPF